MSYGQIALAWLLIGTCLLLMLVILLQRGRGGGLAGAFGGGGGSSAFGAKTGDVFTWITVILAGLFVTLAVVANFVFEPDVIGAPVTANAGVPTPAPGDAPTSTPITIPVGPDQKIDKVEMLTKDGQVIPIDAQVLPAEGEATPAGETPAPGTDGAAPAERGDGGAANQTSDDPEGNGGGQDPGN